MASKIITKEQLEAWLGSDHANNAAELKTHLLELVNGVWTPEQAREDIAAYEA